MSARRTLVAAAATVASALGLAVTLAAPAVAAPAPATFSAPVRIPGTEGLAEPALAIAPDGTTYVTAPGGLGVGDPVFVSGDRGATWRMATLPDPVAGGGDSDIAVDRAGTVFQSGLSLACVSVAASTDQGASWTNNPAACGLPVDDRNWVGTVGDTTAYLTFGNTNVALAGPLATQFLLLSPISRVGSLPVNGVPVMLPSSTGYQWPGNLATDERTGAVYVAWNDQGGADGNGDTVYAARSRDGARTAQTSVVSRRPGDTFDSFVSTDTDRAGNVYVVWSERDPANAAALAGTGAAAAASRTSAVRGETMRAAWLDRVWNGGIAVDAASGGEAARELAEGAPTSALADLSRAAETPFGAAAPGTGTEGALAAAAPGAAPAGRTRILMAVSRDGGATFGAPVTVSDTDVATAIFPWVAAGDDGRAVVSYYGTDAAGPSAETVAAGAQWRVHTAQSIDAAGAAPRFVDAVASPVFHRGPICTSGTGCAAGTRTLLDFFEVAEDRDGMAGIAYIDNAAGGDATNLAYVRQTSGVSLRAPAAGSAQDVLERQIVGALGAVAPRDVGAGGGAPVAPASAPSGRSPATRGPDSTPAARTGRLRAFFSRPGGSARGRTVLPIRVRTTAPKGLRSLVLTIRPAGRRTERVLASARRARLAPGKRGAVLTLRLKRPLRPGRYVISLLGRSATGTPGRTAATVRFR